MEKHLKELESDLLTTKFTRVYYDDRITNNAPHHYYIKDNYGNTVTKVDFQEGPCKEKGVNGCGNEDLLNIVINNLKSFNETPYACRENSLAITCIEEALLWLRKRTMGREKRGIDGTSQI